MSHKNQKQFNVTIINFKNSSTYIQRKINVIFRVYRTFVKTYVNNIIIFNKTLKKHLFHLYKIFSLLKFYNIRLLSKKFYLKYFTVALLNQRVDVFELTIASNKLTTIVNFQFFYILKNLKTYLNFIK